MESATIIAVAFIALFAFLQWMRHQRRMLIYRERIAAIEKGIEFPALEQEAKRNSWNVQRILLLCGMIWITLGIASLVVLGTILRFPTEATKDVPQGIQYVGIAPIGIGIAHLVTYWVGAQREKAGR